MTCRDRNLLALQSELLGAALLGVDGILALSGDPTAIGDFPAATSVNDVNVVGLVKIIASLNRGYDFSDHAIGARANFAIGVGVTSRRGPGEGAGQTQGAAGRGRHPSP